MGSTTIGKLALKIQDDNETNSILPTAQNFEKISEAFDDFYRRGFFDNINAAVQLTHENIDSFFKSGKYYFVSESVILISGFNTRGAKMLEVAYYSPSANEYCIQRCTDLKTGRKIERTFYNGNWSNWKRLNGYIGWTGKNPSGLLEYSATDEMFLDKQVYTTIIKFDFAADTELTFENFTGRVIRYNGYITDGKESIALPYIDGSYDNENSTWLTFKSLCANYDDPVAKLIMKIHGKNSELVSGAKGYVQIWFVDDDTNDLSSNARS